MTLPPLAADGGRVVVSRLIRAKREGVRIFYPLGWDQGYPGSPVVDGADQEGSAITLRGLTPHYAAREGYWLSIENGEGQHFLHNLAESVIAAADGRATLPLTELLREPFPDGARVHLARPMIEGLVEGEEWAWTLSVEHLTGIGFTIEEVA